MIKKLFHMLSAMSLGILSIRTMRMSCALGLLIISGLAHSQTITVQNLSTSGRAISIQYKNSSNTWVKTVASLAAGSTDTTNLANITIVSIGNSGSTDMCVYVSNNPTYCLVQFPGASRQYNHVPGLTYVVDKYVDPGCEAATLNWGAGNFCAANVAASNNGSVLALVNSQPGASGSASGTCSAGVWSVSAPSCSASLSSPIGLFATDGANSGAISVSWGSVSGGTTYRLQQRKQGASTWTDLVASAATSYNWTGRTDESVFEFQVRAENAVGVSAWSAVETGFIRPAIAPSFVSQAGIPAKIGVGQSFNFSQVWKNTGSETWNGGTYGTGPHSPANSSVWGLGFAAFAGSTATNANVTHAITAVAPLTPGVYTLQRIFWKGGTPYGAPSTPVNVEVVGAPTCTAATPSVSTTYNANGTLTITLAGASSVETATIKAWGEAGGQDDAKDYPMSLGSNWTATIPVSAHLTQGETKINFEARVANSLFAASVCATSSVAFQQLPVPIITLTPTMGSFDAGNGGKGFVADRGTGKFALIRVDLGAFSNMKVKIEYLDAAQAEQGVTVSSGSAGADISLHLINENLAVSVPAWTSGSGYIRVSYADPDAATQLKIHSAPITVLVAPSALQVSAEGTVGMPPSVNARVSNSGTFDAVQNGVFQGGLRTYPDMSQVKSFADINANGEWIAADLDYAQLFKSQLIAVARAIPPVGVSLLQPLEFVSAPFLLPVQAPTQVVASDGTREDDVSVNWTPPANDPSIRFRLFRDESEITPAGGVTVTEFYDVPPERGQIYNYRVKTLIGSSTSNSESSDAGFIPACRSPRLIGASVNADMTRVTGLLERWLCLESVVVKGHIDTSPNKVDVAIDGSGPYSSFTFTIPDDLADGSHILYLDLTSTGVELLATRTYEIPFTLNRSSIAIKNLTIMYNGSTAASGLEANSIGRFGIKMDGGSGIGFAEEVK